MATVLLGFRPNFTGLNLKGLFFYALTLFALISAESAHAQTATFNLAWTPPSSTTGIISYRIYVRPAGGTYPTTTSYSVDGAQTSSITISNLAPGNYFFRATSYNGSAESVPSNETAAIALLTPLEGLSAAQVAGSAINVQVYNPGQTTALVNATANANASGVVSIPTGTGLPSLFDLRVNAVRYLARTINNRSINDSTAFTTLPAGDLDDSGTINSFDYGILKQNWLTSNSASDLNKDGVVNSFDYAYLKKNWFGSDSL